MTFASFELNADKIAIPLFRNKRIHSFYDPYKEANRFILAQVKEKSQVVILIGESFGFLSEALIQRGKKVIAIGLYEWTQLSPFAQAAIFHHQHCTFYAIDGNQNDPEEEKKLLLFLESQISATEWNTIQLIVWKPHAQQFPIFYKLATNIAHYLLAKGSSLKTGEYFMPKWISNAFHHLKEPHNYYALPRLEAPLLICAAGPSLNQQLNFIKKMKNQFYLMAFSSALSVLNEANIQPDFVIQTDGGYWANRLIESSCTKGEKENHPYLLTPISASWLKGYPHRILLNQQTTLDTILPLQAISATYIEETPSVACCALSVGLQMSQTLFFVGLDLASNKEITHALPHPRINRIINQTTQIHSLQKELYGNYIEGKSESLRRYSYWFEQALKKGASFYQILPTFNPHPFQGVEPEWIEQNFPPREKKKVEIALLKADFKIEQNELLQSIQKEKEALLHDYLPHLEKEEQEKKWLEVMRILSR